MTPSESEAAPQPDAPDWAEGPPRAAPDAAIEALIVNIEGFEGPLDALLALARSQKVDLKRISILALAEQYLAFMEEAKSRRLELAADYLVMAAWLAYLKSRLILPEPDDEEEGPSGEEMAARLAFQLQRLEAMRNAGGSLLALGQLGRDVFPRGAPEGVRINRRAEWTASLYDLLKAYSEQRVRTVDATIHVERPRVLTIEDARRRLEQALGAIPDWSGLYGLLPLDKLAIAPTASILASTLSATLELVRDGRMEIRQLQTFGPVYVRARAAGQGDSAP